MEKQCKIVTFGDSILEEATNYFEKEIKSKYPDCDIEVINKCKNGETTRGSLKRIENIKELKPTVLVISYGMNDQRKGINKKDFKNNLKQIVSSFDKTRIVLTTITPDIKGFRNKKINLYNDIIRNIARELKIRVADVSWLWKERLFIPQFGLRDRIHPSRIGRSILVDILVMIVPREHTVVLWQYNGREAKCNYNCPYCYYSFAPKAENFYFGSTEKWKEAFLKCFGNQDIIFYLTFGEPTLGKAFYDVVEMIESVPNWKLRITTNLSTDISKLLQMKITKENRLFINASFHPYNTDIESFIERLKKVRRAGIDVPVIIVMYPPLMKKFKQYFERFYEEGFLVHIRRFRGEYKGKIYPHAYTDEQKQFIAKYSDDATIKYMLNKKPLKNKFTYSGYDFFVVDCTGNIGMNSDIFHWFTKYRTLYGNIIQYEHFRFTTKPQKKPYFVFEGTVDGVSNLLDTGYKQLENNNIIDFSFQGGVSKEKYKNIKKDFDNSKTRAKYYFPPRNLKDLLYRFFYAVKEKEILAYINLFTTYFKIVKQKGFIKTIKKIRKL